MSESAEEKAPPAEPGSSGRAGIEHIRRILRDNAIPKLEGALSGDPLLSEIHGDLKLIRETLYSFSAGDFSPEIKGRGIIIGCIKALQAHLKHMIWQVQMVEKGDFSQEIRFMGEFSTAFNSMVGQLNKTLAELKTKEETLVSLTETLRREVDRRTHAVEALQESEARFKYLASHDVLTGAYSRRSFIEMAGAELTNAAKSETKCCMAIMDIDHFKNFNDTYGHLAGDETLRHVVRIVNAGLRKGDFLGRYGGEEFTIFFYRADEKVGVAIAERLRAALEANPVKLEAGDVQVTASFGVAESGGAAPDADEVRSLVNNADIALYAAKRAGRNRVMFYTQNIASEAEAVAQHEGRFAGADAADIESAEEFKKRGEEFPAE